MTRIRVTASRSYDVLIQPGLLDRAGEELRAVLPGARTAAVAADETVSALYGARLAASLEAAGFRTVSFSFPAGEASKNLTTYAALLDFLGRSGLTRSDVLVALGGGVTGDLAGFAAATYQRGVAFCQVPTSLLAAVDSSVGGKTGIDLPTGKNQAGCFYQPSLVLCDPALLTTLPEREYRSGCAEVIKYGILFEEALFTSLEETPVREQWEAVIARCVALKRDTVAADEFDRGCRALLNLGHTLGHAVEKVSAYSVSHGEAVAIGMAVITRAAVKRGLCAPETAERLEGILKAYGLPTATGLPREALAAAAMSDKKNHGGRLDLIVPEAIGRCRIRSIPPAEFGDWLSDGGVQ